MIRWRLLLPILVLALAAHAADVAPDAASAPAAVAAPAASAPAAAVVAPAAVEAPAAASAPPAVNPIQALFNARKYEDAILKVDELRSQPGRKLADADSEYWAARAELASKLYEAARRRFQAIAEAYPDEPRGGDAAVEASAARLGHEDDDPSKPADPAQVAKVAQEMAAELEATAAKYAAKPDVASRAMYVAGNTWRTGGDEAKAVKAYEAASKMEGTDYPARAMYMLGVSLAQDFNVDGAKTRFDDCIKRFPNSPSAENCRKGLIRLSMTGTLAPPLTVETWLNSPPLDMASLRGNVVLVWFFATWCPHCKVTMPRIEQLLEKYQGKPFKVIGITANQRDQTTESAKAFVEERKATIHWAAGVDQGTATSADWQVQGIPAAYLVDKKGLVRWADHPVYLSNEMIEKLLAE